MRKIKVVQVFEEYLPLTETWAYQLLSHLSTIDIVIFPKRYKLENYFKSDFTFVERPDIYLFQADLLVDRKSVKHFILKALIKVLRYLFPDAPKALSNYLKEIPVDIVHSHFANVGWDFNKEIISNKVPHVISFYGWDYERLPYENPAFRQHFIQLFRECSAFICEGPYGAQSLVKQGCPEEKIHVIHLGLNPDEIPVFSRDKKENELELVQIAAFSETKGMIEVVEAIHLIREDCPNINYTIVAVDREEDYKAKLLQLIKTYRLENRIKILPKIPYTEIHPFLRNYQVFVHPSRYTEDMDCEGGAPIIILDAEATGMPILSTDHCDIPNEVIDEQTGILVKEGEVAELAEGMKKFYKMGQDSYSQMGVNARKHVEENFDIRKSAAQLSKVYTTILKT